MQRTDVTRAGEEKEARFRPDRRTELLKERFRDAVGGSPEDEYERKVAARRREALAGPQDGSGGESLSS